jgi:hypothetical protein
MAKKMLLMAALTALLISCGSSPKAAKEAEKTAAPAPVPAPAKATDELDLLYVRARKEMNDLGLAIYAYRTDEGSFPAVRSLTELNAIPGFTPTYIREVPAADPWGNEYIYEYSEFNFKIGCGGSDGEFAGFEQPGGTPDLRPGIDIVWINDNFKLNPQEQ